jgi:hypothetical protein
LLAVGRRVDNLNEEFLISLFILAKGIWPCNSKLIVVDSELMTTEKAFFSIFFVLELKIKMPKLILGAFVGLHFLVLDDFAKLGRNI